MRSAPLLLIEPLEKRQLLTGSASHNPFEVETVFDQTYLTVQGTNSKDIISIDCTGNTPVGDYQTATVYARFARPGARPIRGTFSVDFILVLGKKGNDVIVISARNMTYVPISVVPQVDAGDGNDVVNLIDCEATIVVSGGPGNDIVNARSAYRSAATSGGIYNHRYLSGGEGDDKIIGSLREDQISGDDGWDTLIGGAGDDNIEGRGGIDNIYGEQGNDVLDGGECTNYLYGGSGDDTFIDDPREGLGPDFFFGTGGTNDYFNGESGFDTVIRRTNPNVGAQTFSSTWVNTEEFDIVDVSTQPF